MALVTCPECGRENVSDTALACPNCGYPVKEHFERLKTEKEIADKVEQVISEVEKPEKNITKEHDEEKETDSSAVGIENDKNEKKKKKLVLITAIVIVFVIFVAVATIGKTKKGTDISKIDMSTSLIKNDSLISADKAYNQVLERLLKSLGNNYLSEVRNDGEYIGVYKKGDSSYSYIIACRDKKENGDIISSSSSEQPKCIELYDCTSDEPSVKSLSLLINSFLDNAERSVIEAVLEDKKANSLRDDFPKEFAITINKRVFYVSSNSGLEDSYKIQLAGDYYNYSEINPLAALDYIFSSDESARDKIENLTREEGEILVEYYTKHEQEYFEDFDALLLKSGMKTEAELSAKKKEGKSSTLSGTASSSTIVSPSANRVYTCANSIYKFMSTFEAKPRDTNIFDLASKQTDLNSAIEAMEKSGIDPEILAAAKTISSRVSSWSDVAMSFMALHSSLEDLRSARSDVKSAIDEFVELAK